MNESRLRFKKLKLKMAIHDENCFTNKYKKNIIHFKNLTSNVLHLKFYFDFNIKYYFYKNLINFLIALFNELKIMYGNNHTNIIMSFDFRPNYVYFKENENIYSLDTFQNLNINASYANAEVIFKILKKLLKNIHSHNYIKEITFESTIHLK